MDVSQMHESWRGALRREFELPYWAQLGQFLQREEAAGKVIFPPSQDRFRALQLTPLDAVKVVIIGQDPYHGMGQAHGLSFSVKPGAAIPPSLRNIYAELKDDLGIIPARHGFLESWAQQGVLLLNSMLTVESDQAGSHQKRGWEEFTGAIVRAVNDRPAPCVFLLWGAYAQKKANFVNEGRHLILRAAHPSPLAAYKGFFGCRHFSQANEYLIKNGGKNDREGINWALPPIANKEHLLL